MTQDNILVSPTLSACLKPGSIGPRLRPADSGDTPHLYVATARARSASTAPDSFCLTGPLSPLPISSLTPAFLPLTQVSHFTLFHGTSRRNPLHSRFSRHKRAASVLSSSETFWAREVQALCIYLHNSADSCTQLSVQDSCPEQLSFSHPKSTPHSCADNAIDSFPSTPARFSPTQVLHFTIFHGTSRHNPFISRFSRLKKRTAFIIHSRETHRLATFQSQPVFLLQNECNPSIRWLVHPLRSLLAPRTSGARSFSIRVAGLHPLSPRRHHLWRRVRLPQGRPLSTRQAPWNAKRHCASGTGLIELSLHLPPPIVPKRATLALGNRPPGRKDRLCEKPQMFRLAVKMHLPGGGHETLLRNDRHAQSTRSREFFQPRAELDFFARKKFIAEPAQLPKKLRLAHHERARRPSSHKADQIPSSHQDPRQECARIQPHQAAAAGIASGLDSLRHRREQLRMRKRIRIHKNDPLTRRRGCAAVPRPGDLVHRFENNGRPQALRQFRGSIGGIIVANNQLRFPPFPGENLTGVFHRGERRHDELLLIEGWNNDRNLHQFLDIARANSSFARALLAAFSRANKILQHLRVIFKILRQVRQAIDRLSAQMMLDPFDVRPLRGRVQSEE